MLSALTFSVAFLLFEPTLYGDYANPLQIVDVPQIGRAITAFGSSVVLPAGAILLAGSCIRRYRRLPPTARRLGTPVLVAGLLFAAGDLVLVLSDYLDLLLFNSDSERTALGLAVVAADYGRFLALPILLVIAAARARAFATAHERLHTVDVTAAAMDLQSAVAAALSDPTARVAYRKEDGSWVAGDGTAVELGGDGRRVVVVERDGAPIAAVEHSASTGDRPTTVEACVAAAGSSIEYERLEALARVRKDEALRARRTIVEVQDSARRRLERDLHDGAQQRLVGVALQASLAARGRAGQEPDAVEAELRAGIAATRQDLRDVAAGLLPAVVAERGLGASLAALAATSPMAVELRVDHPAELPPSIAGAAWFVVAEAVANATKHADAKRLRITGGVVDGHLDVAVTDDGHGGADPAQGSGLVGLRDRVERSGGVLTIDSPPGAGTRVEARFPLADAS